MGRGLGRLWIRKVFRNSSQVQGLDIVDDDGALQPVTHETQVKGKLVSELHSHSHL